MAQVSNYQAPQDKIWMEDLEPVCLICQKEKPYNIFYVMDRKFYVCKDCEDVIRGLYKDVVFQESTDKNLSVEEIVKIDLDKMHKILKTRSLNKMYKYALCAGIIDFFDPSFTVEQLATDEKPKETYEIKVEQIKSYILEQEKEKPHTIRFFSFPNFLNLQMDVYAVAKVSNNGSTYVFGDDPDVLSFLARENKSTEPEKIV